MKPRASMLSIKAGITSGSVSGEREASENGATGHRFRGRHRDMAPAFLQFLFSLVCVQ